MDESFSSSSSEISNNSYSSDTNSYIPKTISKCFSKGSFSDNEGIKILSEEEVYQKWISICNLMNLILPVSTKVLFYLLKKYRWNIENIQEQIFYYTPDVFIEQEDINIEEAFCQSNLIKNNYINECKICCDSDYLYKLNCNHECCLNCWKNYIATKIVSNNDLYFFCIETDCKLMINHFDIEDLLNDNEVENNFMNAKTILIRNIVKRYVNESDNIIQCPNGSCRNCISFEEDIISGIECGCGGLYCKMCTENFHYPLKCGMITKFINYHVESNKEELETIKFIVQKTRPCPNCKSDIDKFEGCNHMTCMKCRYEFCWLCLGQWPGYNISHDCNITKSSVYQEILKKLELVERDVVLEEKYTKYFAKYHDSLVNMNHDENLKIFIENILKTFESICERKYLEKGLNKLHRLLIFHRRLIMNIAVFLFFCNDPSLNMTLLECRMSISEGFASSVCNFIAHDIMTLEKDDINREVFNKTIGLFKAISIIFEECENCFNNNYVKFFNI
ncbi:Protein ariadne-1 [Strongyloides ratti]|uniref:RBR-type E3 ubiquitin transferase n=1 Tax=Strongyloides ratti TaxID=34506 RepID=A0A090LQE0_STRRB|nr:Protein ariadne-1 [Strongyloides ratti]CEF70401.1 Protein ariadne-1 [Strongyloides ratti]